MMTRKQYVSQIRAEAHHAGIYCSIDEVPHPITGNLRTRYMFHTRPDLGEGRGECLASYMRADLALAWARGYTAGEEAGRETYRKDPWTEILEAYEEHKKAFPHSPSCFGMGRHIGGGVYTYRGIAYTMSLRGKPGPERVGG